MSEEYLGFRIKRKDLKRILDIYDVCLSQKQYEFFMKESHIRRLFAGFKRIYSDDTTIKE